MGVSGKAKRFLTRLMLVFMVSALVMIPDTEPASAAAAFSATARISSSGGAYLRSGPSKSKKKVALLKNKRKVIISREVYTTKSSAKDKNKWYYVTAGKKKGYVRADLVKNVVYTNPKTAWTKDILNYRAGAGTAMKRKGALNKGASVTVVLEARPYKSKKTWYKVKVGSKYYCVSGDYITWTQPKVVALVQTLTSVSTGLSAADKVTQSAASKKVSAGAVAWAIKISNDNSFHYGNGIHAHHLGCYFCGTQPTSKKKHVVQWQKTYCCNPFIHAAYAHGGNEPSMLSMCKNGKAYDWNTYKSSKIFKSIGHPAISKLQPGDVLCWDGHVAMYVGNSNIVEAGGYGEDDGKPGSKKWNDSIAVTPLDAKTYKYFTHVYRYIGAN